MNGKGSTRRPTDEKKYSDGWNRIFRKEQTEPIDANSTPECSYPSCSCKEQCKKTIIKHVEPL